MEWFALVSVAVFAAVLWSVRRRPMRTPQQPPVPKPKRLSSIDTTPDTAMSFGYKMSWLALKTEDSAAVLESLPVTDIRTANWRTGFVAVHGGHVFVSPPVSGWTLVVSHQLPDLTGEYGTDTLTPLLACLSDRFSEAQYFGTHRVVEYHAWALFKNGEEVRAFAYLGERGEFLVDRGDDTVSESDLGYDYFDPGDPEANSDAYWDDDDLCFPDEEHVMEIAGEWSINPLSLDELRLPKSVGWICIFNPSR